MKRCLECVYLEPFDEASGYCRKTQRFIDDLNSCCKRFVSMFIVIGDDEDEGV